MVKRRPKDIGTAAETAVVGAARKLGFPHAERRALKGSADQGDILLCPGVIAEVKAGKTAEQASDGQILNWLQETEQERVNAGAAYALLVTKRAGKGHANAHQWWTHLTIANQIALANLTALANQIALANQAALATSADKFDQPELAAIPTRLTLAGALTLLRLAGWGDATTTTKGPTCPPKHAANTATTTGSKQKSR